MWASTSRCRSPGSGVVQLVNHRIQRLQEGEGAVRVLFWVEDASGGSHLAVQGTDPRGSGHFTYTNIPELNAVLGFSPQPLRCSNRNDVVAWLAKLGARQMAEPPPAPAKRKLPKKPGGSKARAADGSGTAGAAAAVPMAQAAPGSQRQSTPCLPPTAEAQAAFETVPQLQRWICETPDEATLSVFLDAAERLSAAVSDELPSVKGQCVSTAEATQLLDRLLSYGEASLQLLETTNISPVVGRLRRNANPAVAHRAEQLAARWHALAAATLAHAKQQLGR